MAGTTGPQTQYPVAADLFQSTIPTDRYGREMALISAMDAVQSRLGVQGGTAATAAAGAATCNAVSGTITTESVSTAAGSTASWTITDSSVLSASSIVFVAVDNGTNSAGSTVVTKVTPSAGQFVVTIQNIHATAALNGTLKLRFFVLN